MTEAAAPAAPAPAPAAPAPAPAAPAPAPAAPSPAPAAPAPSPAPAPASESLLPKPGEKPGDPPAPAPADEFAHIPEKYRVMGEDGKLDLAATSKKLGEGYGALAKKLGTGELPPEKPDAYTFTPPEEFKDVPLDETLTASFRERAHAKGITQSQFEFIMDEYFGLVPQVLNAAASFTAAEAKAELSKVWTTEAEFGAGLKAAERALTSAGDELGARLHEKFGRDPDFIRFAASMGKEMKEDRAPSGGGSAEAETLDRLVAHPAYRDAKHPEHAAVSERARKAFQAKYGDAAVVR